MLGVGESVPPNMFLSMTRNGKVIEEKDITDSGQSNMLFLVSLLKTEYLSGWFIGLTQQEIAYKLS